MAIVLKLQSNQSDVTLIGEPRSEGSGKVYDIDADSSRCAKLLLPLPPAAANDDVTQKLTALASARGSLPDGESQRPRLAWPEDLLLDQDDRPRGYVLRRFGSGKIGSRIAELFDVESRRSSASHVDYALLLEIATRLTEVVAQVQRGLPDAVSGKTRLEVTFVGLSEEKLWIADDGFVCFTDADSVQLRDLQTGRRYRGTDPAPERSPPEAHGIINQSGFFETGQDSFALAVALFRLLMERAHPFGPTRDSIVKSSSAYFKHKLSLDDEYKEPLLPLDPALLKLRDLAPDLRLLFQRCFEAGLFDPQERPSAEEWLKALKAARLRTCAENPRHKYFDHLDQCPWHRQLALTSVDPFPYVVDPPVIEELEPERLPAEGGALTVRGRHLNDVKQVKLGEVTVTQWLAASGSELQLVAPPGAGRVDVTVHTKAGRSNPLRLTYEQRQPLPVISGVKPESLPAHGGPLLIEGENFVDVQDVSLGGKAILFERISNERIRADAPPGRGIQPVQVETAIGLSNRASVAYGAGGPNWKRIAAAVIVTLAVVVLLRACLSEGCELKLVDDSTQYVDKTGECGTFYQLRSLSYSGPQQREDQVKALGQAVTGHWEEFAQKPETCSTPLEVRVFESTTRSNTIGGGIFVPAGGPDLRSLPELDPGGISIYQACFVSTRPKLTGEQCYRNIPACVDLPYQPPKWCSNLGSDAAAARMCADPCLVRLESCYLALHERHCPNMASRCEPLRVAWRAAQVSNATPEEMQQALLGLIARMAP